MGQSGPLTAEDILEFRMVGDPQVSPDGRSVAFVLTRMDRDANEQRTAIWFVPADGSESARELTRGPRKDNRPRWSPDGRWLAFLSNRDREWAFDLYVLDARGGEPRRVAQLPRGISDYAWSPASDGFALAGRPEYPEDPDRTPAADEDERRKRYQERVRYVDRFRFRLDGAGLLDDEPRRIWYCALDGGVPAPLTDGPWEVDKPRWTREGDISFLSNRNADHDRSDVVDIWRLPPGGGLPTKINVNPRPIAAYSFGPDGRRAVVGSVDPDVFGGGRHWRLFVDGRCRTQEIDRSVGDLVIADTVPPAEPVDPQWSPDGAWVYFQLSDRGAVHVYRMPALSGAAEAVLAGSRVIASLAVGGETIAFTATSPDDAISLRAAGLDGAGERLLFDPNPWIKERRLGSMRELQVASGLRPLQSWALLPPADAGAPEAPNPTLLYIHGGPHAAYGWSFQFVFQILAGAGYALVFCNPPGSQTYEEDFARAIHGSWGQTDFSYFMAAVDRAIEEGFADPNRLGVGGASYGGFSTLWVISHTERFKAAVAARPVANLQSFYGSSDIGWSFSQRQMGVEPWENPQLYWQLSPVHYLDQITTPLRLIACLSDYRTPAEEAEQVFIRLHKARRKVDLVLFHGEPHGVVVQGKPWNRVRHMRAVQDWFDRHLKD